MSQVPSKEPEFDLAELDSIAKAPEPAPDPKPPVAAAADPADEAPSGGGDFDPQAETLKALHDVNSTCQQILQVLGRLLES